MSKESITTSNFFCKYRCERGFTLIEVVVSTGVFLVVVVIAVGALLSLIDANRKALSQKAVINNVHFAVDSMVRAIRVGSTYHCGFSVGGSIDLTIPDDCSFGDSAIAFEKTGGDPILTSDQVVYRLANSRIERSTNAGNTNTFSPLTAPDVVIENLQFFVTGAPAGDVFQPKILIIVQGYAGTQEKSRTDFDIETLVSQRLPD